MPLIQSSADEGASDRPDVSVIVPCYQSERHIRGCLRALIAQETALTYEIVVVDSSTDGTAAIVAEEFPGVRLVRSEQRLQVGAARNRGARCSRAGMILFVDSDTVAGPSWVESMCRPMREGRADGVGGSMRNGTPRSLTGSAGFYLEFFRFLGFDGEPRPARYLVGGNSGFRRQLLQGDSYADRSAGEDMLFSASMRRNGKRLLFVPRAAVEHMNRTGLRTVLAYQYELGRASFVYRSVDSARQMRVLASAPVLIFFLPLIVLPWIAGTIAARRQFKDLLRFVLSLPVCLAGNLTWSYGLYNAVTGRKRETP